MKPVDVDIFTKEIAGGIATYDNTIMKVTKMNALPDRLRAMMTDLSPVIAFSVPDSYDLIKVTNQTGHASYFESEAVYFARSLENSTIYLSNIPEPGMRYHGGHIFVKVTNTKKRLGVTFTITTWYILAPILFDTVDGHQENLKNKVSERVVPVEL